MGTTDALLCRARTTLMCLHSHSPLFRKAGAELIDAAVGSSINKYELKRTKITIHLKSLMRYHNSSEAH